MHGLSTDLYLARVYSTASPVWRGCACGSRMPCCWDRPDPVVAGLDASAGPPHILSVVGPGQSRSGPGLGSPLGTGLAGPRGCCSVTGPTYQTTCCCCRPLDKLMERKQGRVIKRCLCLKFGNIGKKKLLVIPDKERLYRQNP